MIRSCLLTCLAATLVVARLPAGNPPSPEGRSSVSTEQRENLEAILRQSADVAVTLDITPGVPHVFQAYYPFPDEAAAALDRAGQLLSAYLASEERVTA